MGQKELVTGFGICPFGGVLRFLVFLPVVAFFFTVFTLYQCGGCGGVVLFLLFLNLSDRTGG
jgi:hypothetical protein